MSAPAARGFTLVEIVAVLVILALLSAAGAALALGPGARGRAEDAASKIAYADRAARREATASGKPVRLVLETDAARIMVGPEEPRREINIPLPRGARVEAVHMAGNEDGGARPPMIPCSPQGYTPSYAVSVRTGAQRAWFLFIGLSGRMIEVADESQVRNILEGKASTARGDAR